MGNGSSKYGDAKGDRVRDEFMRNRIARERARLKIDSLPDDDDDEVTDTQRIQAVLSNSNVPRPAKAIIGVMGAFQRQHRVAAFIVLVVLILGLVALGAAKMLGLV